MGGIFGLGLASMGLNAGITAVSRRHSYQLNEKAANNADLRTRALFHDLYSPQAQVDNLLAAGLSPGLMYAKGGVGGSGQAGAQAAPANAQFVQALDLANLKMMEAQIEKIKAETKNTEKDTEGKDAVIQKTNQEILNLLEENKLTQSKTDYQNLINGITQYDLKFKGETYQTDVEQRKVELAKLVEDYRATMANADNAEVQAQIAESTAAYKVKQEMQQVILNDLEAQNKNLNLQLTAEQIEKVKTDIIEKKLTNSWIDIKNEEDIAKLRHDIQMDLYDLDIKEREQNYKMTKGIVDSLLSIIKPMKIK